MNKYIRTAQGVFKVIDERVFCGTKTYYTGEHIINDNINKIEFESDYIIINYDIKIKDIERVEVY